MKKNLKKKSLKLNTETVRALGTADLDHVVGGLRRQTGAGSCETDCMNTCA